MCASPENAWKTTCGGAPSLQHPGGSSGSGSSEAARPAGAANTLSAFLDYVTAHGQVG